VSLKSTIQFDLVKSLNILDTQMTKYLHSIHKPHLQRTRFMASDDAIYNNNIQSLKDRIKMPYRCQSSVIFNERGLSVFT
jgi:hypothetical protein